MFVIGAFYKLFFNYRIFMHKDFLEQLKLSILHRIIFLFNHIS
jgi:hypothetical protein